MNKQAEISVTWPDAFASLNLTAPVKSLPYK